MQRHLKHKIKKRLLAMLAATSLFVVPAMTYAQNITKTDASKASTIKVNGNVTNVTPDRIVNGGKTAINQFSKFDLDKGNIANLHLEKADTLVNFVDSKANINGIVNAVKDNKIGGNLYFLSSKGIAVGADGAINAGKVGLVVPSKEAYDYLLAQDRLSDALFTKGTVEAIPLNMSGSISIAGSINAPGGITVVAQDIKIEPGAKLLNTNTIDYSNIVNTTNVEGLNVSAGLNSNLTLTADDNGGIYIASYVNDVTITSDIDVLDMIGIGTLEEPMTASITVGKGASIISDADVSLNSTVKSNRSYADKNNPSETSRIMPFKTVLDVAGTVKARNITLESSIADNYNHLSYVKPTEDGDFDFTMFFDIFSMANLSKVLQNFAHVANSYVCRSDNSNLNIASTAELNALNNVNVLSGAAMNSELTSLASSKDNSGASALNFTYLMNSANLDIGGTINAGGNVSLNSLAMANLKSIAALEFDSSNNTATSLGFNVIWGESNSKFNIANTAKINAGGRLDVSSTTLSPVKLQTTFSREGSGLGALTINGMKLTSSSVLKSAGTLNAVGDVNVSSTYSAPTHDVISAIIVNNPVSGMKQTPEEAAKTQETGQAITDYINKSQSGTSSGTSSSNITTNAVAVTSENTAQIELGKVTSISGNINVNASTVNDDPQVGAMSIVPVEPGGNNINPVAAISIISNTSGIHLTDDLTANNINVGSTLTFDNPRLEKVRTGILEIKPRLAKVYDSVINQAKSAGNEELNAALDEAKNRLDNYLKKIEGEDGMDPMRALTSETSEIVNDLKAYFAQDPNVQAIVATLQEATDASKVSTFFADKESVMNSSSSGEKPNFSISAAALINIMDNTSAILVDPGKILNATNGDLNVQSKLKNVGLSVSGHILPQSVNTAATDVLVGVNRVNDTNTVQFGGVNALNGNNINIVADNNINHLYLNDGSGKGVNNSYRAAGTVSYAGGKSQANVNVGAAPMIYAKSLNVVSNNNTNLFNVAGGLSYGGGSASVGVGVAVNNFDVDTKAIVGNSKYEGILNAENVMVNATTDGMVNSLSVAGGLSTSASSSSNSNSSNNSSSLQSNSSSSSSSSSSNNSSSSSSSKKSTGMALFDRIGDFVETSAFKKINELVAHFNDAASVITDAKNKIDKAIDEKTSMFTDSKPSGANVAKTGELSSEESQPKITFDGAGSASVNSGKRETQSSFVGLNSSSLSELNVGAFDKNFTGAWSGAGALNFRGADSGKTSVALTGAVAVNNVNANVSSDVSAIKNLTGTLNNKAEKSGALIAAGLGLTVSQASAKTSGNYTGAASASVNLSDNVVKAVLRDNAAENLASINNVASNVDTQVTGGVNVSVAVGGKKGVAGGGAGVWSDISNNVNALIEGGTYKTSGAVNNNVTTTLTDIAGGVGVSVAQGSESSYGFQGVFTFNKIKNNSHADISNTNITAQSLNNSSSDGSGVKAYDKVLTNAGLDVNGDSYSEFAKVGDTDSTQESIENQTEGGKGVQADESVGYDTKDYGNKIVTAALAVAGAGDGAAQASLAISDVDNDFKSEITGTNLNIQNDVNIDATSNTLNINAAAGAAVSSKGFGVGGSISWQVNDNEVVAGFDGGNSKKTLTSNGVNIITENNALEVNVGGQISGGKGAAAGLAMAYNALNDNTNSYLKNAEINSSKIISSTVEKEQKTFSITYNYYGIFPGDPLANISLPSGFKRDKVSNFLSTMVIISGTYDADDANTAKLIDRLVSISNGRLSTSTKIVEVPADIPAPVDVNVKANSSGKVYAVGAGVAASSNSAAINGAVAVNHGSNSTQSSLENISSDAIKNLNINASDSVKKVAVVGGLTISGGSVAVGGSVAYNDVGTTDNQQLTKISLKGNNITAKESVHVNAKDTSDLLTVGVGVGGGSKVAVQGSAAVSTLNKDVGISLDNSTINAQAVSLTANTAEKLITTADVLAIGGNAAVGAGVSVNNDYTKTGVAISGSDFVVKDTLKAQSGNSARVLTVGIGGSATSSGAAVTGSVAVNNLHTNTVNKIDNANVSASKGALVNAKGDESIANYAGSLSVGGSGAAIGLSVSVNNINSNVNNLVNDSKFDKTSEGSFTIDDKIADNALLNNFVDGKTFKPADNLAKHRVESTYGGVVIDANATHDIKSALFNAGATGTGAAINGTVNVNRINGSTSSDVKNTTFDIENNFNVLAHDYSNSAGLVGTANATGTGASIGVGSDSAVVNRNVNASLDAGSTSNSAKNVNVNSVSRQGISSLIAGMSFAGAGLGASNGIGVSLVEGNTNASIANLTGTFDNLNVTANHLMNLNTLGISMGAAGVGAGVGVSVDVLKTTDTTSAAVKNSDITVCENAAINAVNNSNVDYEMYDVGAAAIGGGVAGSIGVANVKNNVSTEISNSTLTSNGNGDYGKMSISAVNDLNFQNKAAIGGLAGLGGGVGIGVSINTIDSSVNTNIDGTIKARAIDLTSKETRNANQGVGVVSGGVGAASVNVMITNVGKELDDDYQSDTNKDKTDKDGTQVNVGGELDKANEATSNKTVGGDNIKSGGLNISLVSDEDKQVDKGGSDKSGTHINVNGSITGNTVNINNTGSNDLTQGLFTGSVGGVSINGAVGILNLNRNASTNIAGNISAENLTINNQDLGTSNLNIMQGGGGLFAANASYGALNVTGKNLLNIQNGKLDTTTLQISNADSSKVNVTSKGVALGAKAAGVLIAEGSLNGSNDININNVELKGNKITINGKASPEVNVEGIAVTGGAFYAGSGLFAGSVNNSSAKIGGKGVTFTGNELVVTAENASGVTTTTDSISGSLFASGSLTGISNKNSSTATISFDNATVNTLANTFKADVLPNQKVNLISLGAGGLYASTGSVADVESKIESGVNLSAKEINADSLKIESTADSSPNISVKGYSAGAIASGSNVIKSVRDVKNEASLKVTDGTLDRLTLDVKTNSAPNLNVNGDGGGIVGSSPNAAVLNDKLTQSNKIELGGTLNIKNNLNVNALNTDAGSYVTDALGAAVIGASGVSLTRDNIAQAIININDAKISTEGSQSYIATNDLGNTVDLKAAGYGGANASAGILTDKTNYTASINVRNSELTATGEESNLILNTQTTGKATSLNNLKAAGALELVTSFSDVETAFDNKIEFYNSTLTTTGNASNINIASNDNTEQAHHTISNIQGGAAGVGLSSARHKLTRANNITVNNSTINAGNNVTFNSGYNAEGIPSKLTLTVFSDVYNKTALPLGTMPFLDNNINVSNTVNFNRQATINAVRDVNINAESGTELITESAKEYNIYTGESGKGNVVVTTGHEGNAYETANNFVQIDGIINAGTNNSLNMTISGGRVSVDESQNSNPTATVTEGKEFFDTSKINFDTTSEMQNPFLEDYNKALSDMRAYTPGSAEYNALSEQVSGIEKIMANYGFADKIAGTDQYVVYEKIEVPAIELPDIRLAGGNININTPNLKGNGTLTANAAKDLTIINRTGRSLLVNDLIMDNAGGKVYLNDVAKTSADNLKLNTQEGQIPSVSISNTGASYRYSQTEDVPAYTKAPDIILNEGKRINNSAGSVSLSNTTGSVIINGEIYSLTSTKISTPNGGTIINNTRGLQNVGEDPMLKYTFGNQQFSDWLQEAVSSKNVSWWEGYVKQGGDKTTIKITYFYSTMTGNPLNKINSSWLKGLNISESVLGLLGQQRFVTITGEYDTSDKTGLSRIDTINKTVNGMLNTQRTNTPPSTKLVFSTYEKYLDFVFNMALKYDKTNLAAHRQYLIDAAGTNSWHKGDNDFNGNLSRWKTLMLAKYDTTSSAPKGAIVAGGAVSVIAKTLNVNGLIQSGFNNYVGQASLQKLADLSYSRPSGTISDSEVIGNNRYRVNDTDQEMTYNQNSGMYDKVVGIYFNPSSKQILTDPLQVSGGSVYLKAEDIVSTGNGKIVAAGGGADINVNVWGIVLPLVVKDINTISRGNPLVMINGVDYTNRDSYRPKSNSVYSWTGGISYNKIETKYTETTKWLWGGIDGSTTENLVQKINNEKLSVQTLSSTTPSAGGSKLVNGVFTDYSGDGNLFTITTATTSGGKVYGKTSTNSEYKEWYDYLRGKKTITYTWTETTPNSSNSTYRINASQPIAIQTSNKQSSTITVRNPGQIIVDGDLGPTGNNGVINLTSSSSGINTTAGSKITNAKINLNAAEAIDVTLGLPDNGSTKLTANSRNGDINITANTLLEDIDISANTNNNGKNVTIIGTDDIIGKIAGGNLEISTPGNIDVTTNIVGKLDAQGNLSVNVTQSRGDLKISKVTSNGDVTLTVSDGALLNADNGAISMTGAEDKIRAWKEAGIISDADSANSSTNSAREEKAVRLTALENLFKRWALNEQTGTVDQNLYNRFLNNTADTSKLTAEQVSQLEFYQELKKSNNYGFSQNQLLYAIQEGLLNPKAGLIADVKDPIITGKNITLTAKRIGNELEPVTFRDLSDTKILEQLAGAKSGDVTFNSDGSVTFKGQSPITVDQLDEADLLNVTTQGNTFISGTNNTKFNVNTPIDAGAEKVVLMTGKGIDASKGITAREVELYAGTGDLTAKNINVNAVADKTVETKRTGIVTTTITYTTRTRPNLDIFDNYRNVPGFTVKSEIERTDTGNVNKVTFVANYTANDKDVISKINRIESDVNDLEPTLTYSRNDDTKTAVIATKSTYSEGGLTGNALGDIDVTSEQTLPVKNITSGSEITVEVKGNILPKDKDTRVNAPTVNLTATSDIASSAEPLYVIADFTNIKAKNAYLTGNYGKLNLTGNINITPPTDGEVFFPIDTDTKTDIGNESIFDRLSANLKDLIFNFPAKN